ncbi:(deoxy)nucleoside triphosphate pyrophosphohydrolase [Devosia albogilva]|uniref:8-oxo-dGTP diphosphatase n=1 Tax=Devosia albogilva TaxID=429726 RepID=A0ABW5QIG2_9HYPH
MSTRPVLLVAAAALIDAEDRILIAQRPEGKQLAGLWEFPGGKLEPGEGPEAALVRELKEELGITVALADLVAHSFASHAYENFHLLMPLFTCRRWQGTPMALEHAALAWVTPAEMAAFPMPPADEPLVLALRDRL